MKSVWPEVTIDDGALEGIKWLAVVLMTGDHVNKFLLNGTSEVLFASGRLAMPLFALVLAYNLARPTAMAEGVQRRVIARMALFGLLAVPSFAVLSGWSAALAPLNIMFTLLTITVIAHLLERRTARSLVAAALVFLIAGSNVEFWWPALVLGVSAWCYFKRPGAWPATLYLAALASLAFINGNQWALAALPAVAMVVSINPQLPRLRWAFYAYYPVHLAALWLIRIPMSKAGYLFF